MLGTQKQIPSLVSNSFNSLIYCLGSLQTLYHYYPSSLFGRSFRGFVATYNTLGSSSSTLYCLQLITFTLSMCLSHAIIPFSLQVVICWSLPLTFHHQGLVVTLMWQLIVQCFRSYQVGSLVIFYPIRNAHILSQESFLLIQHKLPYLPNLIKQQDNTRHLNPSIIFH